MRKSGAEMEKKMIGELKKGWKLIFYGISKTMNLAFMAAFAVIGIVLEIMIVVGQAGGGHFLGIYSALDLGAVFLFCAVLFPGQLATSLDVSLLAQASPYKKKLQTDIACALTMWGSLAAMAVIVIIRLIGAAVAPGQAEVILGRIPVAGTIGFVLILFSGVMYKFFVLSLIIIYLTMLGGGIVLGILDTMGKISGMFGSGLPAAAFVLLAFAFVLAGCGLQRLITRAAYKRPLSKYAFGAAAQKAV